MKKTYVGLGQLPSGNASEGVTKGCLVLEGGAFRAVYTGGVTDVLMMHGINLACTVGVSAGAMHGVNYVAGQIGRAARINLSYRHDPRYVGVRAIAQNRGLIGFDFVFDDDSTQLPLNKERFFDPARRFVAVATDCITAQPAYFERDGCDIFQAVRASASMPFLARMVTLDGRPYLDGGCSVNIPVDWALAQGYERIVVVRTREKSFRYAEETSVLSDLERVVYKDYPALLEKLLLGRRRYNQECDRLDQLEREGRIFVIAPSRDLMIGRLEGDVEKLSEQYQLGYDDVQALVGQLRHYLLPPRLPEREHSRISLIKGRKRLHLPDLHLRKKAGKP